MMNAAMLHQRISAGRWLDGVESLDVIKNSNNPVSEIKDQWNTIRARDFRPVIEPALEAIRAVEHTGRTGGLVKAVRHIAKEAEELAASYADLGADHAGPLFNRVMGNQASDGAYLHPARGRLHRLPPHPGGLGRAGLDRRGDVEVPQDRGPGLRQRHAPHRPADRDEAPGQGAGRHARAKSDGYRKRRWKTR